MFAKKLVTQSMIDAVNQVLGETSEETTKPTQLLDEEKKRMLMEPELDETGFHKAAHAAKKAGQSHFEFQGKKYPATAKSHKEAIEMDESAEKVPTSTGMKVYGSSYGNSAKARKDQTKHSVDDVKGPKTKELKAMDKEPKRNLDEDGDCVTPAQAKKIADKEVGKHEKGLHKGQKSTVKAESYFTNKLLNSLNEAKSTGTEEIFSDNNIGESEMTDKQKAKREKIVMSMKKGEAGMKQRYGKNWKNVMYATATKQAMKEDSSDKWEGEELNEYKDSNPPYREKKAKLMAAAASKLPTKEEVELDEETPKKNQDIADKAYLKHKPGTIKGTMTQIGRFLRGKPEIKEETIQEKNDSHTHAAHYENEKGEWTGMNLLAAKDDEDAIKQAHAKCKEGCRLSKVERHIPVKESKTLSPGQDDAPFEKPYTTAPKNVKDKSGAVHTPMSRAKDLARSAMKRLKTEMLGKAPGNN